MLLPDNIRPENSIYYTGALVLKTINSLGNQSIEDLFQEVNKSQRMSFMVFMLSLDWLYLLDAVTINGEEVKLCI